jgi:hypothetical protein
MAVVNRFPGSYHHHPHQLARMLDWHYCLYFLRLLRYLALQAEVCHSCLSNVMSLDLLEVRKSRLLLLDGRLTPLPRRQGRNQERILHLVLKTDLSLVYV